MAFNCSASAVAAQTAAAGVHADLSHMSHDPHLTAKIMKKRQEEMARRSKLLDPRTRQFGVNHSVLDEQVAAKRAAREKEAQEEQMHADTLAAQDVVLQTVEQIKVEQQRQRQKDTTAYTLDNHHKQTRREYHLSDPKEYTSAYLTLPEEQLGLSSMSKFQGESIDIQKKKQMQRETAAALQRQMQEKRDREQAEKDYHFYHDVKMAEANHLRTHCEAAAAQEAKEEKHNEAEENLALAAARRYRKEVKGERERQEELQHLDAVRNSDLLAAHADYKIGSNGRLLKNEYRRLSPEEEQDVYNTNAYLLLEKKAKQRADKDDDAFEGRKAQTCALVLGAVEQERARRTKERTLSILKENDIIAQKQREQKAKERATYRSFEHTEI